MYIFTPNTLIRSAELNYNFGSGLLDKTYPIGSIYISVNSTDPSTLFGGTWVAFGASRTLFGYNASDGNFNASEKTGGANDHTHGIDIQSGLSTANTNVVGGTLGMANNTHRHQVTGTSQGASSIAVQYITVYMWKRTA